MKISKSLSVILLAVLTIALHDAALANPYEIKNIKVDVEGESAIDAREKALQQARRSAFEVMVKRMITNVPIVDDQTIASMVDSFEINREKLSKNRYLASVNVLFNQRAVEGYLGRHATMALPDTTMTTQPNNAPAMNPVRQTNIGQQADTITAYQTPISPSINSYQMRINLNNIHEWVNIQNRLRAINGIKLLQVNALNARFAVVTISYAGDGAQLQNDLNTRGMQIYSNTQMQTYGGAPYILVQRG